MIAVVETNFIVELVLQQTEAAACEELLSLCSRPPSRIAIPAFAVAEAGTALESRRGERRSFLQNDLTRHSREIGRRRTLGRFQAILSQLEAELLSAEKDEASRWLSFRGSLDQIEVIPLDAEILEDTIAIQHGREIEGLPDAIVLASVKKYLRGIRSLGVSDSACFVSRDDEAFRKPVILK